MRVRIKNIRLKTIIGIYDWERITKQDVIINVEYEIDGSPVEKSDAIEDVVDYKRMTHKIVDDVEQSKYKVLEALAHFIADIVMEDERVLNATVEVDKPGALRHSESVSAIVTKERKK